MKTSAVTPELMAQTVKAVSRSSLFSPLNEQQLATVVSKAEMVQVGAGETVMEADTESDCFFVILRGEAIVYVGGTSGDETEVGRLGSPEVFGEMGLLRGTQRSATVRAGDGLVLVKFDAKTFQLLFEKVPGFGMGICRALADRLDASSRKIPMAAAETLDRPDEATLSILPMAFLQRHRVLPMKHQGSSLTIGFVGEATPAILNAIRKLVPGAQIQPVAIPTTLFDSTLSSRMGKEAWEGPGMPQAAASPKESAKVSGSGNAPALDKLLHRMVEEGASDLHLCGSQQTRWRIDGEIRVILDAPVMGEESVLELMAPIMPPDNAEEFSRSNDTDFAYAIDGLARFRVNMYRDHGGIGSVLRVIPNKILTLEQLGLPSSIEAFCEIPKGLVVVTGPTGSGKSTTLAAMLDFINRTRADHVISLEDPIEFLHTSQRSLFNQREVGSHTASFHAAIRAALREDPDIVLIGEMRDRETVEMAMETANTGHLVFGTLHTATAISTIERIVSFYPSTEWDQVRAALADSLRGVVAQTLCKRQGGGRAAAVEILIVNHAVQNAIRLDKVHQIQSLMETGIRLGQRLLNTELARLVKDGTVAFEEALRKTLDRADLAQRCGKALPGDG